MKRLIQLAILLLVSTIAAQAQTNFQPGYVLPLTGDTLRGEVDLRDGRNSATRCRFRATAQAPATTYAPAELRGYGYSAQSRHYRAQAVVLAQAAPQPYFLEVLVDGPATLFFLRDAAQHELYFVASPTLPLTLLERLQMRVVRDGNTYVEEQNLFRAALAKALAGCVPALNSLPTLLLQESALRRVVTLYNTCQGVQAPPPPTNRVSRVVLGFMGGVSQKQLSYTGYPYGNAVVTGRNTGFAVGPVLRFRNDRLSQKLSLTIAVLYEPEKYEIVKFTPFSSTTSSGVFSQANFKLNYLRVPVMFRYTYPRGKVAPVAEFGFTVAYAINSENSIMEYTNSGYSSKPKPLLEGEAFRAFQLGIGAGIGASTRLANGRAVALLARAEVSNGFSGASAISTSVLHLYGLLSIDLTK